MAGERHGVANWPGAIAVSSCIYTVSHGITPGTAILRILPQAAFPAETGTLVIGDGADAITLPDCKIDGLTVDQEADGFLWSLQIVDRRWKWRDLGQVSGAYNQLDPHGKLIPWTIRSPTELAKLCLEAMGETVYEIDLPPGLDKAVGERFAGKNPPWIGVTPTTGTNPPVNWENEVPAVALQNLCEQFGRRVILRLKTNSVLIAVPGQGKTLPDGSVARESPSIKSPETPSGVAVVGSPTRYQARFRLEAVGEEWDGSFRPLDQLSYAPALEGNRQVNSAVAAATDSNTFSVFIGPPDGSFLDAVKFEITSDDPATAVSDLADAINASNDPRVKGVVTASAASNTFTVTGAKNGAAFYFWARVDIPVTGTASFVPQLVKAAVADKPDWRYCVPPLFSGVRATDRLTLVDAMRLAQGSVYRTYRLMDVGVTGKGPITVPGYGPIKRRQQLLLLPTKVEQIVPQPVDDRLKNVDFQTIILNFYNGYSRDMPAVCYGSTAVLHSPGGRFAFWFPTLGEQNSDDSEQIFVGFEIDPVEQLVHFSSYVFKTAGSAYVPATPILETGVHVRNAETNALECFKSAQSLSNSAGDTNFAFRKFEDVQLNVIGDYDKRNVVTGFRLLEKDAIIRAQYYRTGMTAQYITSTGATCVYNGIVAIDLDGAISQITWEVGPNGASTTASLNTEHAVYVPPYPARRRAEFLRPAQQAALLDKAKPQRLLNPWLAGPPVGL